MKFADKLKSERDRLGLTQVEAAKKLEISIRAYSIWELDSDPKRRPHVLTQEGALARLAKLKPSEKK